MTSDLADSRISEASAPVGGVARLSKQLLLDVWLIGLFIVVASLLVGVATLTKPRTYTATASFMPQSRRGISGAAAGLSAFGINLPSGEGAITPQFLADLVRSRGILGPVVGASYPTGSPDAPGQPVPLADLLEARGESPSARRADAMKRLSARIVTSVTLKTGVVSLSVKTTSSAASAAIADSIIRLLSETNLRGRQTQASAERRFVERRLVEARGELRSSESTLLEFLTKNRDYQRSPQLSVDHDRLQREVGFRQQAVSTLVQAYEQARVEEVRDTPVLLIVDSPEPPPLPDSRRLLSNVFLAGFGAGFAGFFVAVLRRNARRWVGQFGGV